MSDAELRILAAAHSDARMAVVLEGLREAGFVNVTMRRNWHALAARAVESDADLLLIDLATPTRDELDHAFQFASTVRVPLAMFVDRSDYSEIEAAMNAGVSAYIVDGLKRERMQAIVDVAIARFKVLNRLRTELETAKQALHERKIIDRAKGILMKERGFDEEAAYALMRRAAMNDNLRIADVAQSVIRTAQMLSVRDA